MPPDISSPPPPPLRTEQNRTEQICLFGVLYKDSTSTISTGQPKKCQVLTLTNDGLAVFHPGGSSDIRNYFMGREPG